MSLQISDTIISFNTETKYVKFRDILCTAEHTFSYYVRMFGIMQVFDARHSNFCFIIFLIVAAAAGKDKSNQVKSTLPVISSW
jgi:hypothetical protein